MKKIEPWLAVLFPTFYGFLTGFFIAFAFFAWYSSMYIAGSNPIAMGYIIAVFLLVFFVEFVWVFVGIIISIVSSVLFGELFYQRRRNKFRRFIGSTFGSFVSVSIFLAIAMKDYNGDEIRPFIIGPLLAIFLISIVLIILPEIPDRLAPRS